VKNKIAARTTTTATTYVAQAGVAVMAQSIHTPSDGAQSVVSYLKHLPENNLGNKR
jgi:hypothetical protein